MATSLPVIEKDTAPCRGCRNDFYNQAGRSTTGRCWSLPTAEMKTRFRTGTWDDPTKPGAFVEVEVYGCYHAVGEHYVDEKPACAIEADRTALAEQVVMRLRAEGSLW